MEEESQMGAVEVRLPDQKQSGRNLSQKTPSNDRRPPQTDDRRRRNQDARVPYDYGGRRGNSPNQRPDYPPLPISLSELLPQIKDIITFPRER